MQKGAKDRAELERKLKQLSEDGIQADRQGLIEDVIHQFPDYREWVREYVVNGYDAGATMVSVGGFETEDSFSIVVDDNGVGMDRRGILDFCMLFRSLKRGGDLPKIGSHGLGKLSPASAVPPHEQIGFSITTSTGTEHHRLETGSLLSNNPPLKLVRLKPVVPEQGTGTRVVVTFKKKNGFPKVNSELKEYADILNTYLKYLGLNVIVFEMDGDDIDAPQWAKPIQKIYGLWSDCTEPLSRHYSLKVDGKQFDIVVGLGKESSEFYVNKVLISNRYDLLSYGLSKAPRVPHLKIRTNIDGPIELNFGRNRLIDEDQFLKPLSRKFRDEVLPEYFSEIASSYYDGTLFSEHDGVKPSDVEDIACAMLYYPSPPEAARQFPLFAANTDSRLSLLELRDIVSRKGALYIEDGQTENPGLDYSAFDDVPVLSSRQPARGLEYLNREFRKEMVLLNANDSDQILEAPGRPQVGLAARRFERRLGFHPLAPQNSSTNRGARDRSVMCDLDFTIKNLHLMQDQINEFDSCEDELRGLNWKVSFLIHRNGEPCRTRKFLHRKISNTVVLNLHHPEIAQLLSLFEAAPELAAHWATALCLEEKILPHISSETREDLIIMDGMSRIGIGISLPTKDTGDNYFWGREGKKLRDFFRNLADPEFGL